MSTYDSSEHSALPQVRLRGCVLYISSKAVRRRRPDDRVGVAVIVGIADGAGDGTGDGELEAEALIEMSSDPLQFPLYLHSYMYPTPLVAAKRNHCSAIGRFSSVARETPYFCRAFRLSPSPVASMHSFLSSSR